MANRSYLYSCSSPSPPSERVTGLSEWSYRIPLIARILVSGDTQRCRSRVWENDIALVGRFKLGFERLQAFLARIDHPAMPRLRDEALAFLTRHQDDYVVLEGAEIFVLGDDASPEQAADRLLVSLQHIDSEITQALKALQPAPANVWQRIFKPSGEAVQAPLLELGLGYWSTTLYFAPTK